MGLEEGKGEIVFDIIDIINVVKKRWTVIVIFFLAAVVSATVYSLIAPSTYQAVTTLRIKQPKGLSSSLFSEISLGNVMYTDQVMSTYVEILTSRTVIEQVIQAVYSGKEKLPENKEMLERITIKPVKGTEILKVMVDAKFPEEAKKVANVLVNTFMDRLMRLERSEQASVREFIGDQLEQSKLDLQKAEQDLEKYKQNQKILTTEEQTKALVDRYTQIDRLAAENKINIATAQAKLENAKTQLTQENSELVADSPLISQYKAKLADQEIKLVGLLEKYTSKHPQVLATQAEIEETKSKLNDEIAQVINYQTPSVNPIHQSLLQSKLQAEAEIQAATAQQEAILKIQAANEAEIMKLPTKEQGLTRLMRDASVAQEIYVMLAKRFEEARISEMMQPTDVQIIDAAEVPEKPVKPNKGLNIMIAGILGLFLGTGLAFILEYLHKTIATANDVKYYLELPVLGMIPDFDEVQNMKNNIRRRNGARK